MFTNPNNIAKRLALVIMLVSSNVWATTYLSWNADSLNWQTPSGGKCSSLSSAVLDSSEKHSGSSSMRFTAPGNVQGGMGCQDSPGVNMSAGFGTSGTWLYFRWWMKISPSFNWGSADAKAKAQRVYRLEGAPVPWTLYLDKSSVYVGECPACQQQGQTAKDDPSSARVFYNFNPSNAAVTNWQEYIIGIKLQTCTTCYDGEFHFWVNGVEVGAVTQMRYCDPSECGGTWVLGWGGMMAQPYPQLNDASAGGNIWLDDFSTDNTWNSIFTGATPPPAPPPVDTTVPSIAITAPANGITVSSTVSVSGTASDNVGVVGVQFKLDGQNLGAEDTSAPYSASWNTTLVSNGAHILTATARDAAGNTATSASVSVTVNNVTQPFNFSLTNSGNNSVTAGSSATNKIGATLVSGGTQAVTFSASGLPTGATASFSVASCSPTCSSTLTITTTGSTPAGSPSITVTGTGGGLTRTTTFGLTVSLPTVATPTISPNGGSFTGSVSVTLQTPTAGASIYYTTNGTTPTQSSTLYTGPISLMSSAVLSAIAFKTGANPSGMASATFTASSGISTLTNECSNPQAAWIWCDDFETNQLSSYFEYDNSGGDFVPMSGLGVNGSTGMRVIYHPGQASAGSIKLAFGSTPSSYFKAVDAGTANYREIYWRIYVKNQVGWTGGGADKLSRATIFAGSNWSQAAIGHIWSGASPGPDQDYLFLDPASGTDTAGNLKTTTYNDFANLRWLGATKETTPLFNSSNVGQWHCVEAHMKLNTPNQFDGVFELSVDGNLDAKKVGLNWVGSYNTFGINAVFFENYWNETSPVTQQRYIDNIVVSTQPIGCGTFTASTAPAQPTALTVQ